MRTLIVGDVHGCASELAAVVRQADAQQIYLLGDLFTKGPDPCGVWDLIKKHKMTSIIGNHDANVLRVTSKKEGRRASQTAYCLDRHDKRWRKWLHRQPTFLYLNNLLLVHAGIDPTKGPELTPFNQLLNIRRFPDDSSEDNPFWWELWSGPQRIIYGHDARRGLQNHRFSLGLDTGCVYGGTLTAWLVEEDRFITQRAAEVYRSF